MAKVGPEAKKEIGFQCKTLTDEWNGALKVTFLAFFQFYGTF